MSIWQRTKSSLWLYFSNVNQPYADSFFDAVKRVYDSIIFFDDSSKYENPTGLSYIIFGLDQIINESKSQGKPVPPEVLADYPDVVKESYFDSPPTSFTREQANEIAMEQRGDAERAMERAQLALGGSPLSYCLEHTGDLLNRAYKYSHFENAGYNYVLDKVDKVQREMGDGRRFHTRMIGAYMRAAEFNGISLSEYDKRVKVALKDYANAFKALPAYNRCQELMKDAAIGLAEREYELTFDCLGVLKKMFGC